MGQTITLTIRHLLFNNQFWQKLTNTPTRDDKAGYWLNRLFQKVHSAQKAQSPALTKFITELGTKWGMKDPNGKVIMGQNGLPVPGETTRDEYDDMYDQFVNTAVTIDSRTLPLEYFAHIQKTPLDWEILEIVADVKPETMIEETPKSASPQKISAVN